MGSQRHTGRVEAGLVNMAIGMNISNLSGVQSSSPAPVSWARGELGSDPVLEDLGWRRSHPGAKTEA